MPLEHAVAAPSTTTPHTDCLVRELREQHLTKTFTASFLASGIPAADFPASVFKFRCVLQEACGPRLERAYIMPFSAWYLQYNAVLLPSKWNDGRLVQESCEQHLQ